MNIGPLHIIYSFNHGQAFIDIKTMLYRAFYSTINLVQSLICRSMIEKFGVLFQYAI